MVVASMKPVLSDATRELLRSGDVETVRRALPAQIVTLRGLWSSRPGDGELAAQLAQLYLFYASGFVEPEDPDYARRLYAEGRDVGLAVLGRDRGIRRGLAGDPEGLARALEKRGDAELLLWTAACWAGWIGLNLDDPGALADLPTVELLLDRVLQLRPDLFYGMPWLLRGTILGMRPPALGGRPEEAREAFERALEASGGRFLLAKLYFARSYARQVFDRELFERTLREILESPEDLLPEVRLLNVLAKREARRWLERAPEIF
jgi:hypothetical protein